MGSRQEVFGLIKSEKRRKKGIDLEFHFHCEFELERVNCIRKSELQKSFESKFFCWKGAVNKIEF